MNSKFFHGCINKRRKQDEIQGITINGAWLQEVDEVKKGVQDFFKDHYNKSNLIRLILGEDLFEKIITQQDNEILIEEFKEEEVREALFSCESSKNPGLDGFNLHLLKAMWDIFKGDFMGMMREFYENGR